MKLFSLIASVVTAAMFAFPAHAAVTAHDLVQRLELFAPVSAERCLDQALFSTVMFVESANACDPVLEAAIGLCLVEVSGPGQPMTVVISGSPDSALCTTHPPAPPG